MTGWVLAVGLAFLSAPILLLAVLLPALLWWQRVR